MCYFYLDLMLYFVFVVHPALGYCSVDPAVLDGYVGFGFVVSHSHGQFVLVYWSDSLSFDECPLLD